MNKFQNIACCPVCNSAGIRLAFEGKDFSVSGEGFDVWECSDCSLRFTQGIPSQEKIGAYYKSENYISHSNTSSGIVNKLYHWVRLITLKIKTGAVKKETGCKTGKLLDIGAGTGAFAGHLLSEGWNVTGLEPDDTARQVASKVHRIELLGIECLNELPAKEFDAITMWHVLEHVHELQHCVATIGKLLKKNGVALIAVPNYTSWDSGYYGKEWAAYDLPRHLYHFSPASMSKLMQKHGMVIRKTLPMWFDSFYVSMLSEKYKGRPGLTGVLMGGLSGILSNCFALLNSSKCSSLVYVIEAKG